MFQQPVRPNGHVHVEFRAGRMEWDGRVVTADKRKGKIILYTSEDEQLTHFQWVDREKSEVALDLIVINDAYLEKIEKCTTGRVYLLRFTSSDKKLFFWMQEPKEEADADLVKRFNEAIGAKIPEKGSAATQATPPASGAATGAAAAGPASAGAAVPQGELRAILQQFLESQGAQGGSRAAPTPLNAVLTTELLQSLLADEAACSEMMPLLPESHRSMQALRDALASPQLQQSINSLSQALHSDQLPVLLTSLGLDPGVLATAAPGTDALEVLCRAMEAQAQEVQVQGMAMATEQAAAEGSGSTSHGQGVEGGASQPGGGGENGPASG